MQILIIFILFLAKKRVLQKSQKSEALSNHCETVVHLVDEDERLLISCIIFNFFGFY